MNYSDGLIRKKNEVEFKCASLITNSFKIKNLDMYEIYNFDGSYYATLNHIICTPLFEDYHDLVNYLL